MPIANISKAGEEKTRLLLNNSVVVGLVRKETAEGIIGHTGGSLFLRDSAISLHVPEGALITDLHVTISYLVSEQDMCINRQEKASVYYRVAASRNQIQERSYYP